jgi:hypothetical protein
MSPRRCPFCEQPCPADAKFCGACGGVLHLVPCARCGAVNDVTAAACYQCNAPIAGRDASAADAAAPPATVPKPSPPRRTVAAGAAVVVALVALGYFGYRQGSPVDAPQPPPASSEAGGGPAGTAAVDGDAASGDATSAKSGDAARPASPVTLPPKPAVADRAPAPDSDPRANAAAGRIVRPRPGDAGKAGRQAPPREEVCTEAVAALGLCTMTPEERGLAEAAAAVNAAVAPPAATESGKAEQQEPPRQEACTEAVAALGLCTPASTQRGE